MSKSSGSVTLHEEIVDILREHGGGWMSTREIAAEVNRRGRYHKGDRSPVEASQIGLRTRNYSHLFERDGSSIRLLGSSALTATPRPTSRSTSSSPVVSQPARTSATPTGSHLPAALTALARPSAVAVSVDLKLPDQPGLYAVHGDAAVWKELQLGSPPDDRPLYAGKSESSLHGRDIRTHFADGRTGSSTLRRSFAALLHDTLGLRGMPRNPAAPGYFQNYGLSAADDAKLTAWMLRRLRIAVWPSPDHVVLAEVERQVLGALKPPLNLKDVMTPWSNFVSARRRVMGREAESWRSQG